MFKKLLDQGQAGDNIGALLRGLKREDVQRGQVISRNISLEHSGNNLDATFILFVYTGVGVRSATGRGQHRFLVSIVEEGGCRTRTGGLV